MKTAILDKMEKEALGLSREERAFLADRLLSSLGDEALGEVDAAWVAEAEHRYEEYKEGKRAPISANKVFAAADRKIEDINMITLELGKMSRSEKLETMEKLWADLSRDDASVESPSWHHDVLKETEQRFVSGLEQPVDWTTAKQKLRKRFE